MKLLKYLSIVIIIFIFSCDAMFGELNNVVDPDAENYQGYESLSNISEISLTLEGFSSIDYVSLSKHYDYYFLNKSLPKFSWDPVGGTVTYSLEVNTYEDFTGDVILFIDSLTTNNYTPETGLSEGSYYWRVRQKSSTGFWSGGSNTSSFYINLHEPSVLAPVDVVITDTTPTLSWTGSSSSEAFALEIYSSVFNEDNLIFSSDSITANSYTVTTALESDINYFWRVKQKHSGGGWSDWSNVNIFDLYSIDYAVGDIGPTGGYIIYVDSSGSYDGWRYLEAASEDISATKEWGTFVFSVNGADGTAIGTGAQNTLDIISGDNLTSNAAHACADYSVTVGDTIYDDWFLPSKDELDLIYNILKVNDLGGLRYGMYWSSSEYDDRSAWEQDFLYGEQSPNSNDDYGGVKYGYNYVRPIRAF